VAQSVGPEFKPQYCKTKTKIIYFQVARIISMSHLYLVSDIIFITCCYGLTLECTQSAHVFVVVSDYDSQILCVLHGSIQAEHINVVRDVIEFIRSKRKALQKAMVA
jgi:hypothetical protein